MNYLLDTHYLLWSITDSKRISKKIRDLISDPGQTVADKYDQFMGNFLEISNR